MAEEGKKVVNDPEGTVKGLDAVTASLNRVADAQERVDKLFKSAPKLKGLRDARKELEKTEDAIDSVVDELDQIASRDSILKSMFPKQEVRKATQALAEIEKEIQELESTLAEDPLSITSEQIISLKTKRDFSKKLKSMVREAEASGDKIRKAFGGGGFFGTKKGFGEAFSQFKDARKDPQKMQEWAGGLKQSGMIEKTLGKGMMGKAASGAVGKIAAGGLAAKAVPVAGWIYTALDAANTAITSLDNYRKEANQAYAGLAGPQMNGEGFGGRSKTYNKSIRNVGFNMEMGMGAEDWNAMFQSMKGAGVGVDQLSKSLGSQKDVMRSVRETGIALGMSTDVMGEAYTTMSLETKSGLQTIQDGFEDVARGAQRAGISTDKFYSTIQASVLAMGSYGNFVSIAASSLDKLANSAGMSFQDASSMANATTTGFKDMGAQERLSYAGLLTSSKGGKAGMMGEMDKVLADIDEKLKGPGLTEKERSDLGARKYRISEAKKSNDLLAFANILPDLSGATSKMDMDVLTMAMGGSSKDMVKKMAQGQYSQYADKLVGKEKADRYMGLVQGNMSQLGGVSSLNSAIQADPSMAGKLGSVLDVLGKGELMTPEDNAFAEAKLEEIAKASGMTGDQTKALIAMAKKSPKAFAKSMRPGLEKGQISAEEIAVGSAGALQDATDRWNKDQVKGQTDIIKELTPMQKLFDITKDSIFYNMSASDAAVGSAKALTDIKSKLYSLAGYLMGSDTEEEDASAEVAKAAETLSSVQIKSQEIGEAEKAIKGMTAAQLKESFDSGGAAATVAKSLGITSAGDLGTAEDLTRKSKDSRKAKLLAAKDVHNSALQKVDELQTDSYDDAVYDLRLARSSRNEIAEKEATDKLTSMGYSAEGIEAALDQIPLSRTISDKAGEITGIPSMYQALKTGDLGEILEQSFRNLLPVKAFTMGKDAVMGTPSSLSGSSRTVSVGTMNINQPTDMGAIEKLTKRQEFNSMTR